MTVLGYRGILIECAWLGVDGDESTIRIHRDVFAPKTLTFEQPEEETEAA